MWADYRNGQAKLVCKSCPYAKVFVFVKKGRLDPTPYAVWSEIFQLFGTSETPWRIAFFPSPIRRRLPAAGQPLGPEHVNGGYTLPCSAHGIVIYRKEEATRVLLHELFHATCCDRHELCLEDREAETEVWAELTLIAFLANGKKQRANELLQQQLQWMAHQHATLRGLYGVQDKTNYVWRYTLGREPAFCRLGIEVPVLQPKAPLVSSRFTHPNLEI